MIFTFYSYKGGVGRSMALANVAEVLCRAGLRVLMVDWDLEAPGLEQYYPARDVNASAQPGVIDLLLDYKAKAGGQWDEAGGIPWLLPANVVIDIYDGTADGGGRLQLISAGKRDGDTLQQYAGAVLGFDWANFYHEWEGDAYFEWLRQELAALADVVLIDSRTGVTEMGGVCTYQLADGVVLFCAGNRQNVSGTRQMAESFSRPELLELRRNRPLELLVVPSRIDTSDSAAVTAFRQNFNDSFAPFVPAVFEREEEFFFRLLIPYKPTYAFSENLALSQTDPSSRDLTQAYLALTDALSGLAPVAINIARLNQFKESIGFSPSHRLPLPRKVPPVGALPPGSRLPHAPNPFFMGRDKELEEIADNFVFRYPQAVMLIGSDGVGKSTLAAEFAYHYGRHFAGGVSWINFADPAGIPTEVAAAGRALGVATHTTPINAAVQATRQAWEEATPRLLVFDGCDNEALLAEWRPKGGGSRVLVTSRGEFLKSSNSDYLKMVSHLHRPECIALLRAAARRDFGPEEKKALEAIAAELGDLPLAARIAGGVLGDSGELSRDFLRTLRGGPLPDNWLFLGEGSRQTNPTTNELNVARVFTLALSRLTGAPGGRMAFRMLARATAFAPGTPLPVNLLFVACVISEAHNADVAGGELMVNKPGEQALSGETATEAQPMDKWLPELEEALQRLLGLGILEPANDWAVTGPDDRAVRLHRLITGLASEALRLDMPAARIDAEKLGYALFDPADALADPQFLLEITPHIRHVTDAALEREDEEAANLAIRLASFLLNGGDLPAARLYVERSLPILERVWEADHPNMANALLAMGGLLRRLGELATSRPYVERAVAIQERALGPEHLDVAESLDFLGSLLLDLGNPKEARPYLERALAIRERAMGLEDPRIVTSLDHLGTVMLQLGDPAAARPYYERALVIREKALGPEDPATASSLNNLGGLLYAQGDLTTARPLLERSLTIRERVLGPEHPDTASSLSNLGYLLQAQGELATARTYLERALAIRERVLGPEHPDTAASLANLAFVLLLMGDSANTRLYLERALAIRERVLGPEHPDTGMSLFLLGSMLISQGEVSVGSLYMRRATAIFEKTLGPDHQYTRGAREWLAESDVPLP